VTQEKYCPDCRAKGIITLAQTRAELERQLEKMRGGAMLIKAAIKALEGVKT
jgi:hypothetical protein